MCPQLSCSPQSWWKTGKKRKKTQVHPEFFSNSSSLTCSFGICQGILYQNNMTLIEQVPWWRKGTKLVQIHQHFLIFCWLMDSNVTEIFHEDPRRSGTHPHLRFFSITWWSSSSWRLEHQTLNFQKKMPSHSPFQASCFFVYWGPRQIFEKLLGNTQLWRNRSYSLQLPLDTK